MTVCGAELYAVADALGLTLVEPGRAELALVDLRDPGATADAARLPTDLRRVVVIAEEQRTLVSAMGLSPLAVSTSAEPAAIGPLIRQAFPAGTRRTTRSVLVTSLRGGVGRTLLVANLARRLPPKRSVLALDLTGTGGLGAWLGAHPASWSELEGLAGELTAEHLAVIASEVTSGLRLIGGAFSAPSLALTGAVLKAALDLAEIVLIDAPVLAEERVRQLLGSIDRILVVTYDDPLSQATLDGLELPDRAWVIASQSGATQIGGREVFRALPRADAAVASAAGRPGEVGGPLGRAYADLASLIELESS